MAYDAGIDYQAKKNALKKQMETAQAKNVARLNALEKRVAAVTEDAN